LKTPQPHISGSLDFLNCLCTLG